jgi:polyisoprenoid-binding protein YceI
MNSFGSRLAVRRVKDAGRAFKDEKEKHMAKQIWEIDSSHSGVHFTVRHLVVAKVRGQFARWSGRLRVEDGDLASASVEVVIDASSIDTGVADRDTHLRSADFLDVEKFPEITFKGKTAEKRGEVLTVTGDLTIHGVTREAALEVEYAGETKDPWGNQRVGFSARTAIDRKDFGLTWNQALEAGGVLVGDRIAIEIEVEAVKQTAEKAA